MCYVPPGYSIEGNLLSKKPRPEQNILDMEPRPRIILNSNFLFSLPFPFPSLSTLYITRVVNKLSVSVSVSCAVGIDGLVGFLLSPRSFLFNRSICFQYTFSVLSDSEKKKSCHPNARPPPSKPPPQIALSTSTIPSRQANFQQTVEHYQSIQAVALNNAPGSRLADRPMPASSRQSFLHDGYHRATAYAPLNRTQHYSASR